MTTILAALDNSLASGSVLASAQALSALLGSHVEAVHVQTNGHHTVRDMTDAAGIALRTTTGSVVDRLVEAGEVHDVVALAIGASITPASPRPLVAPRRPSPSHCASRCSSYHRTRSRHRRSDACSSLSRGVSTSLAPRSLFEVASGERVDVVALHIHDEDSIPSFTDQPQHEMPAWTREFIHRYCPWGIGDVQLETRIGKIGELVPIVAEQCSCDLIALGWSQQLAPGRAPVVQETLQRSHLPVLLVPVELSHTLEGVLASPVATT